MYPFAHMPKNDTRDLLRTGCVMNLLCLEGWLDLVRYVRLDLNDSLYEELKHLKGASTTWFDFLVRPAVQHAKQKEIERS